MKGSDFVRCRVAACRESLGDGKSWSFYLINDGEVPLDAAVLTRVGYEWGDMVSGEDTDMRVLDLAAGAHALIWRDDGDAAEVCMDLSLDVRANNREVRLLFEFPKLYRKSKLPRVEGLGKSGWQVAAEG